MGNYPLVIDSRTDANENCELILRWVGYPFVVYGQKRPSAFFWPCRDSARIWVGWLCNFTETVVLSYEHDPNPLYVGWQLNGITVIDPGFSQGNWPYGDPVPGLPSLTYVCPYQGFYHKIAITGSQGMDEVCLWAQVLYRPGDANPANPGPALDGPGMNVCIDGYRVIEPVRLQEEWRACLAEFAERLRRFEEIARINPGDPVERWLEGLDPVEGYKLVGMVETLGQLDPQRDEVLQSAIENELRGFVERLRQSDLMARAKAGRAES